MGRFTMVCVLCALVGLHSAVAFSRVVVRIFEGSNNFPALHFPRTDAAECDSHFYVLFSLGKLSLEDFRRRVIDTVLHRGQLFGFSIYLFILFTPGRISPGGEQRDRQTGGRYLVLDMVCSRR